jgi:UTP--glucose-1-phosphate uridylyltransferase
MTPARIRKALIPVAGRATRLRPASYAVPKGLFPLVDLDRRVKPVVQLILEEAFASGVDEACLVTGPGEDQPYRRFFDALVQSGEPAWQDLAGRVRFALQPLPEG